MGPFEGFFWAFFSNIPSFDATERLFRLNWSRISPEGDWCYLKTFVATNCFVATNFCCNKYLLQQIFLQQSFIAIFFATKFC